MWKLTGARQIEDENGELLLIHLDENGEETQERLLIPVTLDDDWDWDDAPEQLNDSAVTRLLMEMVSTLTHITDQYELEGDILYIQ